MLKNLPQSKLLPYIILLVTMYLLIITCQGPNNLHKSPNIALIYQQASLKNTLNLRIHHFSIDSTRIYIQIPNAVMLNKMESAHQLRGIFRWKKITVHKEEKAFWVSDTSLLTIPLQKEDGRPIIYHNIILANEQNYILDVELMIMSSQKAYRQTTQLFKQAESEQNFLLIDKFSKQILMDNVATVGQELYVKYGNTEWDVFNTRHYPSIPQLALPPFVTDQQQRPISALTYETKSIEHGILTIEKTGTYFISYKNTPKKGFVVMAVPKGFPKLTQAEDLVNALRYITKNKEFKELQQAQNVKRAIDNFWLKRAGSPDRGRTLVKEFYGRVQRANQFFTTYKEGWKTDRGLIFIIYGEPAMVQKNGDKERWEYKGRGGELNQVFTFKRTPNELSNNRYVLERRPEHEASWHRAVYEWRKGVIQNKSGKHKLETSVL